jgi:PmbA protein
MSTQTDSLVELQAIADRVIDQARAGEHIEVSVSRGGHTDIRVYQGEVEHFVSATDQGISVRVIKDGRTGSSYAGTLDESAIAEVLAEARENAELGSYDEWAGLADPDGVPVVKQQLWDDVLVQFPTEKKIDIAKELERLATAGDPRVRIDDANYSDGYGETAFATTNGIRAADRANSCYASVSTLAEDNGETQTGWAYSVGRNPTEFDLQKAGREAAERATRLLGAVKPQSKKTTVVLDPFVTAQFLSIIGSTLNGESVVKGRSIFANRVGEDVAHPSFVLIDDPTDSRAYTAAELDGEGLATRRNVLIDKGVLRGFVHSSYSARRAGTQSTGNAIRSSVGGTPGVGCLALQIVPGTKSQEELIAAVSDGVLVQSVQGLHSGVNAVSGDFSTGASGLMIRNGVTAEPVREFTIASTLQRMLLDIVEIGADIEWLPMRATGVSLVISDVMLSGA